MALATLILGLVLFLGIHVVPAVPPLRAALAARFGENRYKGLFSIVSGIGTVAESISPASSAVTVGAKPA